MVNRLDDVTGMRASDPSDLMSQMAAFPGQLEWARDLQMEEIAGIKNVVICGVGGSAIAGDVITDILTPSCMSPIITSRSVTMPGFADADTLALVISYSGNTAESLNLYEDAMQRGCRIVTITSGGELEKLAIKNGHPFIKVPVGNQPRASLGYLLGAAALVLQKVGLCHPHRDLCEATSRLRSYLKELGPEVPTSRNQAKKIALALREGVPAIYSPRHVRSIALRWQNQINENSKSVAFSGEIPEMNHNQLVGWLEGGKDCSCRPVFLLATDTQPTVRKMTEVTLQMFNERGLDPIMVNLPGDNLLDNVLQGISLGDMVSYYLAVLKGVDPAPVAVIKEFKERISH
ncbi:MAG: bifunctional phosphoglucose/phosphomannose isomerase [Methanomassiliicoccales archaeon]|nr:bifunctional phosphoglucose/phosphomannose isomerase [Methanomassiliicoccales archaeon]